MRHNADYALYQISQAHPDAVRVRRDAWLAELRPFVRARALNLFADLYPGETYPLALRALYDANPGGANTPIQLRAYGEIANEIYDELRDAKLKLAPSRSPPLLCQLLMAGDYQIPAGPCRQVAWDCRFEVDTLQHGD